ncbi:hypothetical protein [Bradyrhizobium roseum]|uniref:hypothetical protein n=1 Tax=Bradyrhizobium roseum TaxID=3056648 RepID=UPI00260DAEAD|nr:hypothetical protein [Bradyrhizobium roseus]WKA29780.1 hypothetical protein QUH67_06275 [Bradyrhizobium roseus]
MTATPDQMIAVGKAARDLLRFAWTRTPRFELMIANGLIAVGKTFAADPSESAALLKQAIEPGHLKDHGYKELRWIAHEIRGIAKGDPGLAIDIYRAAYGYVEVSGDATNIGNSAILPLRSNRRQDYEGAWFQLSEAIPALLNDNLEAGVRAVVVGLHGYVERERRRLPRPGELSTESFPLGPTTASFKADLSCSWYRGGYQPMQDGPVLLKKFDAFLEGLASDADAQGKIERILSTLSREPDVPAAIWGSLLVAGTRHPSIYGHQLVPLACAAPIMMSSDTRYQLGTFIGAAYAHLAEPKRGAIEHAILSLPSDRAGDGSKAALIGCIPKEAIASAEMRTFIETLEQTGATRPNTQPVRFTSSSRPFDTDAYLASEGVSLDDPESAALRETMRDVEALVTSDRTTDLSLSSLKQHLVVLDDARKALLKRFHGRVPDKLFEHAIGHVAYVAGRIAHAAPKVLAEPTVKTPLKRILLFCAGSEYPRHDAERDDQFHENLSWGGQSARTEAAHGLIDLTRASQKQDRQVMTAIRKLARDRVPEVRLQIIQNLSVLRSLDPNWVWSELEHVLAKEPARGLVDSAIGALAAIIYQDVPRSVRAAKGVIRRYRNKEMAGMAACRLSAATLIFDIHILGTNAEADKFAESFIDDVISNAGSIQHLVARYSDKLLTGSLENPQAKDNRPRQNTLAFYRTVTELAFSEIEKRATALDIRQFSTWPDADQAALRDMVGILNEVALRLYLAAGTHYNGSIPPDDVSPPRARLYWETKPILARLAKAIVVPVAHHLVQALETFIPLDPPGVFALIAQAVKSAEQGGYSDESMGADLIVRIVQRYLADYRGVFADRARLDDLMDCLDVFVRAGWPAAQALTFKLGEIWR